MHISVDKTELLAVEGHPSCKHPPIILVPQNQALEEVESFPYLDSEVGQSVGIEKEVAAGMEKASQQSHEVQHSNGCHPPIWRRDLANHTGGHLLSV